VAIGFVYFPADNHDGHKVESGGMDAAGGDQDDRDLLAPVKAKLDSLREAGAPANEDPDENRPAPEQGGDE